MLRPFGHARESLQRKPADLVLWDDKRKVTITQDLQQDGCDYTPYEGMEVTGWPVRTIMKGRTIMAHGVVSKPKNGTQLKRTLPRVKTY